MPNTELNLIELVKSGDAQAFELLAQNYSRVLNWYIKSLNVPYSEQDDLFQEGLIGLLKAVRTYDSRFSAFATYASICIKRNIISALRKLKKQNSTFIPYQDFSDFYEIAISPESDFIDKESTVLLYNKVFSILSDFESSIFELYLSGLSYSDIAKITNKDIKSISNAIYRIRKKLKALLTTDNIPL